MPTTIWDSSLITKRRQALTASGSFISRITNPVNPNTSYAPSLGIYDNSILNNVKNGKMTYFRKGEGGSVGVGIGCPCPPPIIKTINANNYFVSDTRTNISFGVLPNASAGTPSS